MLFGDRQLRIKFDERVKKREVPEIKQESGVVEVQVDEDSKDVDQ